MILISKANSKLANLMVRAPVLLLVTLLVACGSTSKLKTESASARKQIADFDRVEVIDFEITASSDAKDDKDQAAFLAAVHEARSTFADQIAEELRERVAFDEISREALDGAALRITGTITRFVEGNVAARMVTGFVGQAHFEATVTVSDKLSGDVLGSFDVDRNSWPLPIGASSNALQNVGMFMSGAAKHIAEELAIARGKAKRRSNR